MYCLFSFILPPKIPKGLPIAIELCLLQFQEGDNYSSSPEHNIVKLDIPLPKYELQVSFTVNEIDGLYKRTYLLPICPQTHFGEPQTISTVEIEHYLTSNL